MTTLSAIVKNYKARPIGVARSACNELSNRVIYRTPVDTGLLRASWTPGLNTIDGSNRGGNAGAVTARMQAGDSYSLTNGQGYVRDIEHVGTSQQAPQGMLYISTAQWDSIVKAAVRNSGNGI